MIPSFLNFFTAIPTVFCIIYISRATFSTVFHFWIPPILYHTYTLISTMDCVQISAVSLFLCASAALISAYMKDCYQPLYTLPSAPDSVRSMEFSVFRQWSDSRLVYWLIWNQTLCFSPFCKGCNDCYTLKIILFAF